MVRIENDVAAYPAVEPVGHDHHAVAEIRPVKGRLWPTPLLKRDYNQFVLWLFGFVRAAAGALNEVRAGNFDPDFNFDGAEPAAGFQRRRNADW
jgi:hypothetical protein